MRLVPVHGTDKMRVAFVDDADWDLVSAFKWRSIFIRGYFYAVANTENRHMVYMHRLILNPPEGMVVDHRNHDTLDNRRSNIWICTHQQNCMNRIYRKHSTALDDVLAARK